MSEISIRPMSPDDYDEVYALWQTAEGVGLNDTDGREPVTAYLHRNAALSMVACDQQQIVGAVLCGHDGRRGYLHHLAVKPAFRRQGIGTALTEQCLAGLAAVGISRCHVFVYQNNDEGAQFWKRLGWIERIELKMLTMVTGPAS